MKVIFKSPVDVLMISVSNFSWAKAEMTMVADSRLINNNNVFIAYLLHSNPTLPPMKL
jgi:hypothetical protein